RDKDDSPAESDDWQADEDEEGLHPLLVLPLSFCTGGLFGLFYAWRVCSAYAGSAGRRSRDSAGRPLGRPRHPLSILVLTMLTLGFYFPFWLASILRECAAYTGKRAGTSRADLTLMLVFPPYAIFVAVFRVPARIRAVQQLAGVPES